MDEFVRSYGIWILLAVVFVAMHRVGTGCCLGRHDRERPAEPAKRDAAAGGLGGVREPSAKAERHGPREGISA